MLLMATVVIILRLLFLRTPLILSALLEIGVEKDFVVAHCLEWLQQEGGRGHGLTGR
jgi:hypothetical protein